jgi:hypothetical protein
VVPDHSETPLLPHAAAPRDIAAASANIRLAEVRLTIAGRVGGSGEMTTNDVTGPMHWPFRSGTKDHFRPILIKVFADL